MGGPKARSKRPKRGRPSTADAGPSQSNPPATLGDLGDAGEPRRRSKRFRHTSPPVTSAGASQPDQAPELPSQPVPMEPPELAYLHIASHTAVKAALRRMKYYKDRDGSKWTDLEMKHWQDTFDARALQYSGSISDLDETAEERKLRIASNGKMHYTLAETEEMEKGKRMAKEELLEPEIPKFVDCEERDPDWRPGDD
ncbi:hypothetical protein BD779DRAFT_1479086 [Infundibulicybe gibba]|nr:hypothetical protein BD779DRAFT_1479086 [Infundibulicybe gibba]